MPNLLNRLKKSNPNVAINKWTVYNKFKESKEGNIKNINYTLRYEKPTPQMKKISSKGSSYSPGKSVYGTNYGSSSKGSGSAGGGASNSKGKNNVSASGNPRPPTDLCSSINNEQVISAMKLVWSYNRGYANSYSSAQNVIVNYAQNSPATYSARAAPCLATLSKYCSRKDGINAASRIKADADHRAMWSGAQKRVTNEVVKTGVNLYQTAKNRWEKASKQKNIGAAFMTIVFG